MLGLEEAKMNKLTKLVIRGLLSAGAVTFAGQAMAANTVITAYVKNSTTLPITASSPSGAGTFSTLPTINPGQTLSFTFTSTGDTGGGYNIQYGSSSVRCKFQAGVFATPQFNPFGGTTYTISYQNAATAVSGSPKCTYTAGASSIIKPYNFTINFEIKK